MIVFLAREKGWRGEKAAFYSIANLSTITENPEQLPSEHLERIELSLKETL